MPRQAQTHWVSRKKWDDWPWNSVNSDLLLERTGKSSFCSINDTPFSHTLLRCNKNRSTYWWLEWAQATWLSMIAPRLRLSARPPQSVPQASHRLPSAPSQRSMWPVTPSFSWSSWHPMVSKLLPKKSKTTLVSLPVAPPKGQNPPHQSEVRQHLLGFNSRRVNHQNQGLQAARKTSF